MKNRTFEEPEVWIHVITSEPIMGVDGDVVSSPFGDETGEE